MLHTPKLLKVEDQTLDITKEAAKVNLTIQDVIPTKIATFTIKDWLAEMTGCISYGMSKLIPTSRISNIVISCDDSTVMNNHVITRLKMINFNHDSPLGPISLDISHSGKHPNPMKIYSHDFKGVDKKKVEKIPFMVIGPGCRVKIDADVVRQASIDSDPNHNLVTTFSRAGITECDANGTPYDELSSIELEYNNGKFHIYYQDTYNGKDVLKLAVDNIIAQYQHVLDRLPDLIEETISKINIMMPNDPSTILSNLIQIYLYAETKREVLIKVTPMNIGIVSRDKKMIELFKIAVGKIIADLKSLV